MPLRRRNIIQPPRHFLGNSPSGAWSETVSAHYLLSLLAPSTHSTQMTSFPMPYGHQAPHSYSSSLPQQSVNDHYGDSIVARKTSLLGAPPQPSTPGASPSSSSSLDPCRSSLAIRSSIMCTIQVLLAIVPLSQNSTCWRSSTVKVSGRRLVT